MGEGETYRRQDRFGAACRPRKQVSSGRRGLTSLADDVAALAAEGRQVVLVSSGAIALGRHLIGTTEGRAGTRADRRRRRR